MKTKAEIQERLIILETIKLKHENDDNIMDSHKYLMLTAIKDQIKVLEWVLQDD